MTLLDYFVADTWPVWGTFVASCFVAFASISATAVRVYDQNQAKIESKQHRAARDDALNRFMVECSELAMSSVATEEQFTAFQAKYGQIAKGTHDLLDGVLSPAEAMSIFAPSVVTISYSGAFNEEHNRLVGTLYHWIDQARLLASFSPA